MPLLVHVMDGARVIHVKRGQRHYRLNLHFHKADLLLGSYSASFVLASGVASCLNVESLRSQRTGYSSEYTPWYSVLFFAHKSLL